MISTERTSHFVLAECPVTCWVLDFLAFPMFFMGLSWLSSGLLLLLGRMLVLRRGLAGKHEHPSHPQSCTAWTAHERAIASQLSAHCRQVLAHSFMVLTESSSLRPREFPASARSNPVLLAILRAHARLAP
ncbi:MAG TPA: hypothetical protein VK843_19560 [Planctomycetota bacterium]|nr:hypothetical protein [Planctomycetota bacterium]